jgi:UDP-N-acetyl-D-glucosamine dehydrogenase
VNNFKSELIEKIKNKSVKVGIIGLGYVGLPLALEFAEKNIEVLGFDLDEKKIESLRKGATYIKHISGERISESIKKKCFDTTTDFSRLSEPDAIIICVPTPLNEHREPDMTYIENTARTIRKFLRKGQLITLESTTYPGTTEEILLPLFENPLSCKDKFKVGDDFFLAYSPEREDPNNPKYNTSTIPKVVGGVTNNCLETAKLLYEQIIVATVPVSSAKVAEATKLLENIYRSVNIALVNELKMVFHKMGIDVWEVINAASTKPFGFQPFFPGPGLGGHCIPIDPFYLTWKAREYEVNTKFIELAGEINTYQPYYVVHRAMEVLNEQGKALKDAKILLLGAAYKKNVDDMRESPSLKLIELLREKGGIVDYNDPYVSELPATRKYRFKMKSVDLTEKNLKKYDLVIVSTDHDYYKNFLDMIVKNSESLLDTRNLFKDYNVFKA